MSVNSSSLIVLVILFLPQLLLGTVVLPEGKPLYEFGIFAGAAAAVRALSLARAVGSGCADCRRKRRLGHAAAHPRTRRGLPDLRRPPGLRRLSDR